MKSKEHNWMVRGWNVSFESFVAALALWTLVTLLIKLIRILLKWKYIQHKNYAISATMLQKRSYFV